MEPVSRFRDSLRHRSQRRHGAPRQPWHRQLSRDRESAGALADGDEPAWRDSNRRSRRRRRRGAPDHREPPRGRGRLASFASATNSTICSSGSATASGTADCSSTRSRTGRARPKTCRAASPTTSRSSFSATRCSGSWSPRPAVPRVSGFERGAEIEDQGGGGLDAVTRASCRAAFDSASTCCSAAARRRPAGGSSRRSWQTRTKR